MKFFRCKKKSSNNKHIFGLVKNKNKGKGTPVEFLLEIEMYYGAVHIL
jgi:hypothetical protein